MCISSERSEFKDAGTAALQEKARFPYPLQRVQQPSTPMKFGTQVALVCKKKKKKKLN